MKNLGHLQTQLYARAATTAEELSLLLWSISVIEQVSPRDQNTVATLIETLKIDLAALDIDVRGKENDDVKNQGDGSDTQPEAN